MKGLRKSSLMPGTLFDVGCTTPCGLYILNALIMSPWAWFQCCKWWCLEGSSPFSVLLHSPRITVAVQCHRNKSKSYRNDNSKVKVRSKLSQCVNIFCVNIFLLSYYLVLDLLQVSESCSSLDSFFKAQYKEISFLQCALMLANGDFVLYFHLFLEKILPFTGTARHM